MSDGLTEIPEREAPLRIRHLRAHLVLHAPPGRVDAREQRPSLRGRAQLVMPVPRGATDVHQAPASQRPDVAQERRPVHPQALREWRETDAVAVAAAVRIGSCVARRPNGRRAASYRCVTIRVVRLRARHRQSWKSFSSAPVGVWRGVIRVNIHSMTY